MARRPRAGDAMTADGPGRACPPPRQTTAYLKELFAQVGFTIDARRGQNFLVDLNLLDVAVRAAAIAPDDIVLEVGTGTGALTERLAAEAARVVTGETRGSPNWPATGSWTTAT
ncbi:MAG: hypothetical protein FJ284_10770 [Planctomycetes bacterium]|nr:hypothetical protein [Planctomycetota bacterium]